jgi:hypothetical protein
MELHEKGTPPPSAIIWWLNRQGSMDMPGAEEDKKFTPTPSIKPYLLKPLDSDNGNRWHQNWQWMEEIVLGTVESEAGLWKKFGDSRNKMKDLVAAAEEDEDGAGIDRLFRLRPMEGDLNPLKWLKAEMRTHYMDNHLCAALLDAAELYDIHFPIKSGGATHETVA